MVLIMITKFYVNHEIFFTKIYMKAEMHEITKIFNHENLTLYGTLTVRGILLVLHPWPDLVLHSQTHPLVKGAM